MSETGQPVPEEQADHRGVIDGASHVDVTPEGADREARDGGPDEESTEPQGGVCALPLRPSLEAIMLVVDEPIDVPTLAAAVDRPSGEVAEAMRLLADEYAEQDRGYELRQVGGGWRLYAREQYADVVERFVLDGQQAKLTRAALETLTVVAYRQPVSRARVSAIRGVNCDGVMRTLANRSLVEEAGSDDESNAVLYRTTSYFLERLGLSSLEELPDLAPYLPEVDQLEPDERAASTRSASNAPADGAGAGNGAVADAAGEGGSGEGDMAGTAETPYAAEAAAEPTAETVTQPSESPGESPPATDTEPPASAPTEEGASALRSPW